MDYSESTRRALINGAITLFTERGYTGTSLDEIARRARVTKGALYHHFNGKQALFEAAFDAIETQTMGRLADAVAAAPEPFAAALAGLRSYLQICLEPGYQRLVVNEAPVVLGWERWKSRAEHFTFGLLRAAVDAVVRSRAVTDLPIEPLTRLLFGALNAGAVAIATSADPDRTRAEVQLCIERVLWGLRQDTVLAAGHPVALSSTG